MSPRSAGAVRMAEQATEEKQSGPGDRATSSPSPAAGAASADPDAPVLSPSPDSAPAGMFGAQLEPVLRDQCGGRLSAVNWFRTDWQRGGALTGYATWSGDGGEAEVVVKLPVPPRERLWLTRLQVDDAGAAVVPKVFADGEALGGYDLAWVVMERLPHGPLGSAWGAAAFELLVDAAARFHRATAVHAVRGDARLHDWDDVLKRARKHIRDQEFPDRARWSAALKKASKKLKKWRSTWEQRPVTGWVHGDLHLGNAMTRCAPPDGPAVLFDLAHVCPGHWVEDAIYVEHLYWSHPEMLDGHRICSEVAKARRALGLEVDADWPRLAEVRRALFAMSTPVTMNHDGGHRHIGAALEVLEREVG